jgi:hypothetical protein
MGRGTRALCGGVAVVAATLAIAPAASGGPAPARSHVVIPSFAQAQSRIISVRVWHTRIATVPHTNARHIGRSLASLHPTWVTGLLRYARNQYPHRDEVRAWHQIRRIIRTQNPQAQFDVVLNALQYRTPAAVRMTMRRLRAKLNNDGWFFDFYSTAFAKHPKMIRAAIASAHAHGEWIGGNVFGLARHQALPARSDFFSVQDHGIHLRLRAVRRLAHRGAVMYHLQNDPDRPRSGGCRFIRDFNDKRRRAMLRGRASQQDKYRFRMSYPALYPECFRHGPDGHRTFLRSYNAFRHPKVAGEISHLLDRYDFDPASRG